jgi:hypothetical protein
VGTRKYRSRNKRRKSIYRNLQLQKHIRKINEKVKENYLDILDACLLENTEELNISEYKKIQNSYQKNIKNQKNIFCILQF